VNGSAESTKDFLMKTLASLEKKIRSVPGVTDVNFQFLNWKKEKGQWIPKKEIEE
jgi:predicted RND superfamily exporter protein